MSSESGQPSGLGVRLIGPPDADGEYIGLRSSAGVEEIVHLHDYDRIYSTSGLYERIVQGLLRCTSPQIVADALARTLETLGLDPAQIRLLDLGAGTGLVGQLVAERGVADVIGLDSRERALLVAPTRRLRLSVRRSGCYQAALPSCSRSTRSGRPPTVPARSRRRWPS